MAAKKLKTSEKASLITKLTTLLKKKFGGKTPRHSRNVLETYMYAACVENTLDEAAAAAYAKLLDTFHDLNEIRVSTVLEIERPLNSLADPEYRAMRIREGLQHTFEKHFAFDLEGLKKKNQDGATADLDAMTGVTPFIKLYTLQNGLGAHVIPLDEHQLNVLIWLGLVAPKTKPEAVSDELKGAIRKNDAVLFTHLLRQAANDLNVLEEMMLAEGDADDIDHAARIAELGDLLDGKKKRKPAKKKPAKKKAAKKSAAKKPAKKTAPKKTAKKKAAAKKTAPKKAAKKKTAKKAVKKKK